MKPRDLVACITCLWLTNAIAEENLQVNVVALYSGKVVVIVNKGKPQTLAVGQKSIEGIKLLSANSSKALLEIEGKRKELGMGQAAIVAGANLPEGGSAILYADSAGHHFTDGLINNARVRLLVDTGASSIAMNSSDAQRAGIDYKKGERSEVQTANGNVIGYHVVINSLKLGSMTLNQVDGMVLEGNSPAVVLLGLSALNRLDMKREGIALTLTKKY
ncbi:MAG: TIGR02281 family clan AA aspartic protease [Candidatus Methylopumilus sp.]|jgi:aspartyl protease family protein